ncbi:MAG: tetratricopeptide repeat protein [Phycisphaerae bacterium]
MTILKRLYLSAGVACIWCFALPLGCEGESRQLAAEPETQPSTAPAPAEPSVDERPEPLPAKALAKLDELEPKIVRPEDPKTVGRLPPRVHRDVEEAEKQLAQKKYAAAIELLERAVGFAPTDARIRRLLGKAYLGLPNRGKALSHLAAAAKAAPDDLETHLLLGQLAAAQQQNETAILQLRTALKCSQAKSAEPLTGEALLTLSLLLDREGYWTAALEAYTLLSDGIGEHGREYAARQALQEWVLRPERLLSRRGSLLLVLRRPAEAAKLLDRAYRRDRTNGRTAKLLIDALLAEQRYAEAEKLLLEMAGQPTQRVNVPYMLATLCRITREEALPERFWSLFRAKYSADVAVAMALVRTAEELGWNDAALSVLKSVLSEMPTDKGLWRVLCRSYARQNRYERLLDIVERSLSMDANSLGAIADGLDASAAAVETQGVEDRFAERALSSESAVKHSLAYLAGRVASARRKHKLAADLYRRAIERKKVFLAAYEALLDAHIAQKQFDQAEGVAARLDKVAKDTHFAAYLRGKIALGRGDASAAVEALERAARRNADDLATVSLLARAYVAAGKADQAVLVLRKAFTARPDSEEIARQLFDLYMSQRKFREARDLTAQIIRRDRESTAGRLMMAELALRAGQRNEAMVLLGQLSRQVPENAEVQSLSVRALLGPTPGLISKKQFDDASDSLNRVMRAQPDHPSARKAMGELLAAVGKTAEAVSVWATVFKETPGDLDLARRYVAALIRTKQYEQALRAVERFRKENPEDLWARIRMLELLGQLKRFDRAGKLGDEWVRQAKDENVEVLYRQELLGIMREGKQHQDALKIVEQWIAKGPSKTRLRQLQYTKVHLLGLSDRHDEAGKLAVQLAKADPFSQAGRVLIVAAIEAEQFDRALDLLDEWTEKALGSMEDLQALRKAVNGLSEKKVATDAEYAAAVKRTPEALNLLVSGAVESGQYDKALAAVDQWTETTETSVDEFRTLKIVVCGRSKQLGRARHLAEEWIKTSPQSLLPRRALLGLLTEADADAEADKLVTKWLKQLTATTSPTQPAEVTETVSWLREMSIRLKMARQELDLALELAERQCKLEPTNPDFLALKSACLTELGRDDEALTVMAAALALKPDDASLGNNLGYLYAERGIELEKAEKMLRKALTAADDERSRIAYEDSLAWILYKQGRLGEAGRAFQRLVQDRQDEEIEHGVILDHAGDTYYRLGWRDEAVELWRRALVLAKKVKRPTREERQLLSATSGKIKAVESGQRPQPAPLGKPGAKAGPKGGS